MSIKEVWTKGKKPQHLLTHTYLISEKEQLAINIYFDKPSEVKDILFYTRAALDLHDNAFKAKLEAVQKAAEAKVETAKNIKKDKK
jgi:hypothetical protein